MIYPQFCATLLTDSSQSHCGEGKGHVLWSAQVELTFFMAREPGTVHGRQMGLLYGAQTISMTRGLETHTMYNSSYLAIHDSGMLLFVSTRATS